jgi:hypothetical protein
MFDPQLGEASQGAWVPERLGQKPSLKVTMVGKSLMPL